MSNSSSPAIQAFAITPSDSVDFTTTADAIYVGAAGNIVVVTPGNIAVTFAGASAGSVIPVNAIRVNSTSTTASGLVGLVQR